MAVHTDFPSLILTVSYSTVKCTIIYLAYFHIYIYIYVLFCFFYFYDEHSWSSVFTRLFLLGRLLEVKLTQSAQIVRLLLCAQCYFRYMENNSEQDTFVGLLETDDKTDIQSRVPLNAAKKNLSKGLAGDRLF